jgi:hypothetical protein
MLWIVEPAIPAAYPPPDQPLPLSRGGKEVSMLKVVGYAAAQDEVDGRSLLDKIAREGARRLLLAALESEVAAYL